MTDVRAAGRVPKFLALIALATGIVLAGCQPREQAQPPPKSGDAAAISTALKQAPTHGFRPGAFGELGLDPNRPGDQPKLIQAAAAYARAQHGLSIPKASWPQSWGLSLPDYDAAGELNRAIAQNRVQDWLNSLPPPSPRYQALRQAYGAYLKIATAGGWPQIPEGPPLKPGSTGPRVDALRARLAAEDGQAPKADPGQPGARFDEALGAAVRRAQGRYGLHPTGVVDKDTLAALNTPALTRTAQIRANLERLRWEPRQPAATRIEVNTAAGTFEMFRDGASSMRMLAASGKPGDESPMLVSAITQVVLNPAWNVPGDIAKDELYPKNQKHPGYFSRNGFVTKNGQLVQRPGPKNALGQVKFLFDNPYQVYLHDTPSKSAFTLAQRSVSHGCVRLQKALVLAQDLLQQNATAFPPEKLDETLAKDDTTYVKLSSPMPVALYYLTAFPDGQGGVAFRQDVYGWDELTLRLLDAGRSS